MQVLLAERFNPKQWHKNTIKLYNYFQFLSNAYHILSHSQLPLTSPCFHSYSGLSQVPKSKLWGIVVEVFTGKMPFPSSNKQQSQKTEWEY